MLAMPFYDYQCRECQAPLEVRATVSQKEEGLAVECPDCKSPNMVQVFKSVAFVGAGSDTGRSWQEPSVSSGPCGSACGCHPHG